MFNDLDYYESYYGAKLWSLIPAVYRAEDTDQFDKPGPLREMVARIGRTAALLRRSIDRLWEDQSIETCDDWVISYIADLLATNLISSLDARGQRIDVAKTIYYRRRKGTLAILEEIAADITGWDARCVEFFRRLGRTRHNFDPAVDMGAQVSSQLAQAFLPVDGTTTAFSFTLAPTPIKPRTVEIYVGGIPTAADNGHGALFGRIFDPASKAMKSVSGTVDYVSGALNVTFAAALQTDSSSDKTVAVLFEYVVNDDRSLQLAEGLVGPATKTLIGGWADLRNVYGAGLMDIEMQAKVRLTGAPHMAFDEFSHTADFRKGVGQTGWHNIPKLGVFLWRLRSFGALATTLVQSNKVQTTTPVPSSSCAGQFSFDPTGRDIPLFAVSSSRGYGDDWVSPAEWRLPTPITSTLLAPALGANPAYPLYAEIDALTGLLAPNAFGIFFQKDGALIPASQLTPDPAASSASGRALLTTDGSTASFSPTLPSTPIAPHSVVVDVDGVQAGSDNGGRVIVGPQLASGSVDYDSGNITLNFETPPTAGATIAISYNYLLHFVDPLRGRLVTRGLTSSDALLVSYHYGFPSTIGAGPYDRRESGYTPAHTDANAPVLGGGDKLAEELVRLSPTDVLTIGDSLTYTSVKPIGSVGNGIVAVTIGAENKTRPLIRLPLSSPPPSAWVFIGGDELSMLTLDGLFVSGVDIVLQGTFDTVSLVCVTLDPGNSGALPNVYRPAIDERELAPCHIWIEASIKSLTVDRSILGPIRTRGGEIETLTITNSIVQSVSGARHQAAAVADGVTATFTISLDPAPILPGSVQISSANVSPPQIHGADDGAGKLKGDGLSGTITYETGAVTLDFTTAPGDGVTIEVAFEDNPPAIEMASGLANISRSTILGPMRLHRLEASECILDDVVNVINTQDGCVRFSAFASGSKLPRQYESVCVAPRAPLFTTREFGQPAYAQLLASVDNAIVAGAAGATIAMGAADGSEMGAYARDKNPIKQQSILIKYQEYMPLGLVPVIIPVT